MTTKIETGLSVQKFTLGRLIGVSSLAILASSAANLGLYAAAGQGFPEVTAWPGASWQQYGGFFLFSLLSCGCLVLSFQLYRQSRRRR